MFWLAAAALSIASWVPMRWGSTEPSSLDLLDGGPINCLLLEPANWSGEFVREARAKGYTVLGEVRNPGWSEDQAAAAGLDGLLLVGIDGSSILPVYTLPRRERLRLRDVPLAGTAQGLWPGIRAEVEGAAHAAPSGAPWIETNAGFLRFVRSQWSAPFWIAVEPPIGHAYPISRYQQTAAEAAMFGARWVVTLDADLQKRLFARDALAIRDWRRLQAFLRFVEEKKAMGSWPSAGALAVIQDPASAGLLSGGILDMLGARHTPVRALASGNVRAAALQNAAMVIDIEPESVSSAGREALRAYSKAGGTVLTGPAGWRFPRLAPGQFVLPPEEVERLDAIWKEVNQLTGRRNLGVRLFNAASMLSHLVRNPAGGSLGLHLLNYTDFPVENLTAHVLGKWKRAVLYRPGSPPKELEIYPIDEGMGVEIPEIDWYAILVVE